MICCCCCNLGLLALCVDTCSVLMCYFSRWGALSLFDAVVKHMAEHNKFGLSLDMFGNEMDF